MPKMDQREKIEVNTFNWGPCLVKLKIAEEFRKLLLSEGEASKENFESKLAGQLHKEIGFRNQGVLVVSCHERAHLL